MTNPLLRSIPESLDTDRLLLRCPRPGDGAMLHATVVESIAALREFPASLPWAVAEPTADASESYCRLGYANFIARRDLPYLLLDRVSGELVGGSGLHRIDWKIPRFEIGFWCRISMSGRGLVTEAVHGLAALAFGTLGARRVEIIIDDANRGAARVCDKAGFSLEGTLRHERIAPDGSLRDTRVYARTG